MSMSRSLKLIRTETPNHVTVGNHLTKTLTTVTDDGRAAFHFHSNPQELAAHFGEFLAPSVSHLSRQSREPRSRRPSAPDTPQDPEEKLPKQPRLNIAIHIVGSRGDVQPFIPIAQILSQPPYSHRVRICTHPVFKDFVESKGIEFFSIGGDPEALMAYMVKNPGLLPSMQSLKAGEVHKRRKEMAEILEGTWRSCIEPSPPAGRPRSRRYGNAIPINTEDLFIADLIIANPPSLGHIHCAERLSIPLHMVFTMPWCPTKAFHHPLAAMQYGQSEAATSNYLSFIMMELLTWQGLGDIINKFRSQTLGLDPISPLWGNQLLTRLQVPYTYLWSPSLIPKPSDWGAHIDIAGFSFMHSPSNYLPPGDLVQFLDSGTTPIYIGFGSIVVDDPEALTNMIFEAVSKAGVRAIVSRGWGKIGGDRVPENVFMVGDCPHDWLFPRVSCVVHHGGAGTTAAGLAAGRPTVVVPFFGDQPFWGQMIAQAGAGPAPTPFRSLTAAILAHNIEFALKPEVQAAARQIAQSISKEDGAQRAAKNIHDKLAVDDLSCDICPNLVAAWKHHKTGAHLSTLAVLCLVDSNVIKVHHLRMLRQTRWYVDEGAESPFLGGIAAFSGVFTGVSRSTKDFVDHLKAIKRHDGSVDTAPRRSSLQALNLSEFDALFRQEHLSVPRHMRKFAKRVAAKSCQADMYVATDHGYEVSRDQTSSDEKHSRLRQALGASGRYVMNVAEIGLAFPGNFFYNVANGFRNFPSYAWHDVQARRREEVTGIGSGLKVAGQEFGMGVYLGLSEVAIRGYMGGRTGGAKGCGIGIAQGATGLFFNLGSAVFGLLGYTLKGVEKEVRKRHMSEMKAEMLATRLQQGIADYRRATPIERNDIVERWKNLYPGMAEGPDQCATFSSCC